MASAEQTRSPRRLLLALAAAPALLCALALTAPAVSAATPEELWTTCLTGPGAGQCVIPRGVAADPHLPGHVYVADQVNQRIDEFTAWGQFVKAWGWGVADGEAKLETCGPAEPQTIPPAGLCRAGLEGTGAGQFGQTSPQGVAVDSAGDVYAVDTGNHRVEKFDPEGHFLVMFGGEVNKTKTEAAAPEAQRNRCPVDPGDVCQAGVEGTGDGQFGAWTVLGSYIAIVPGPSPAEDKIYVGDVERIQGFNPNGEYTGELKGGVLTGQKVQSLAAGPEGDLYLAFEENEEDSKANALKLDPSVAPVKTLCTIETRGPRAIAAGPGGEVFVANGFIGGSPVKSRLELLQFNSSCGGKEVLFDEKALGKAGFSIFPADPFPPSPTGLATGAACLAGTGRSDLYLSNSNFSNSFLRALGPAPDRLNGEGNPACPPPKAPPQIDQQFATSVESEGASVGAKINPRFWPDTTYYVEYGTGECAKGDCPEKALFPGSKLGSGIVRREVPTAGVFLSGLAPQTTYHYRFVAQSSGGGPVYGIDPDGAGPGEASAEAGREASFRTYALPGEAESCPANQAFRTGASALLPDCRAYEMVSPLDKENGDVLALCDPNCDKASLNEAATSGEKLTYSSYRAFGDTEGGAYANQYIASRGAVGWSNHSITPPRGVKLINTEFAQVSEYKLFSPDLCQGWLILNYEASLDPAAPAGFPDVYRRRNCGEEDYEALSTQAPPHVKPGAYNALEVEGASADGSTTAFIANDNLADAPVNLNGRLQLYVSSGGQTHFACILPGGAPTLQPCAAGTKESEGAGLARKSSLTNAISEDGSLIYWSESGGGSGKLYVRSHPEQGVVAGECSEAAKACTIQVSAAAAQFWSAAADGSRAIYTVGEKLFEFDLASKSSSLIAEGVKGLLGASEDARRIYFASTKALTGAEENGHGEKAVAGQNNLYYREAGQAPRFLGALAAADFNAPSAPIISVPKWRTSRVSPDGLHAAFASSAPLTGYDNTDAERGEADAEVFLYDARANGGAGGIICASCNPSGARPLGANVGREGLPVFAAATIPVWGSQLYGSLALSGDGSRLFFEARDALVPRDTNGRTDVYEWEAPGAGGCAEASPSYFPANGGCIYLISSGQNPGDAHFVDASPDGRDVFFTTEASLLPQDYGLIDVYDARAGGGFPAPPGPPLQCEGQTCQAQSSAPNDPTPASASFHGAGDPVPLSCPKGRRKVSRAGKESCVARQRHKSKRKRARAHRQGRAAR